MRSFLQHLKAAWRYGTTFPYINEADAADYWTEQDARATESFFNSYTGKKLSVRLTNFTTKMALAAVQNPNCSPYMNGQASGVGACIAAIEAHYPQASEQPETEVSEEVREVMEMA